MVLGVVVLGMEAAGVDWAGEDGTEAIILRDSLLHSEGSVSILTHGPLPWRLQRQKSL